MKPDLNSIPEFYKGYIQSIIDIENHDVLTEVYRNSIDTLINISEEKANYAYAEGKWTIKDILQHLIDSERIFAFRALSFSRGEKQNINGYDHDVYVDNAFANSRSFASLLEEFKNSHQSTIDLFNSFSNEMLQKTGNANGSEIKVIDIIYITAGHQQHHMNVLRERYV